MSFDNFNKTYNKGSNITGVINIGCVDRLVDFTSINLNLTGSYTIKNTKVNPASINVIKFYTKKVKVSENGKLRSLGNNNTFHFKFPLVEDNKDQQIYETYQGVILSIGYEIQVELNCVKASYLSENKKIQIFVPGQGLKEDMKKRIIPYEFEISPDTLERIKISQTKIPKFRIQYKVDNTNCDMNNPFDGIAIVKETEIAIKSLELQFVRNETINLPNGDMLTEVSEIQNLQIGDGDVNHGVEIPLFMIFPRFFACASLETKIVKITFEINLIVVLINGLVITENFPINTWRS